MTIVAQGMQTCKGAFMQIEDFFKNMLCFKNHLLLGDFWVQGCNCFSLWKATIIDNARPCAKSSSLGSSLGCWYLNSHGLTMCAKIKLKILVAFGCPCCYYITCMLRASGLFNAY
jgi:hypothetical protein